MSAIVLLHGTDSEFLAYASIHLAALGLKAVPVLEAERLAEAWRELKPTLVLLHWDTLGEASFRALARLKAAGAPGSAPVALVSERLQGGFNIMKAFASGADELIEGAGNPRLFAARIETLLRRRRNSSLATMAGG